MNHAEQRVWMIQQLLDEDLNYKGYTIPNDTNEQKDMLRALMNVREPKPISQEFLDIQDEYLKEENNSVKITDVNDLTPTKNDDRLYLWQGDITALRISAITNPANDRMCGCFQPLHSCADNIIHSKSGIQLRGECFRIMKKQGHPEPTGQAKITPAYNLPCDYILHTVGPIVQGPLTKKHEDLLASCYKSCLDLADKNGVTEIAFCCISTGVFMFPNQRAAEIAVETVKNWLDATGSEIKIVFNVFKDLDFEIYEKLLNG